MFFEAMGVWRHMASHVGDTWQAMCHNAWRSVFPCGRCLYKQVTVRRKRKEKKNKRERKERKRRKEKRERKRRKRERKKEKRKAVFRQSELVRPRSKVLIFDEGCATRGRFPPTPVHFTPRGRVGA